MFAFGFSITGIRPLKWKLTSPFLTTLIRWSNMRYWRVGALIAEAPTERNGDEKAGHGFLFVVYCF
ncbi:hypothetical protein ACS0TY_027328 [Phlomoides rotata]